MRGGEKRTSGPGRAWRVVAPASLVFAACVGGPASSPPSETSPPPKPRSGALSYERLKVGIEHQREGRHVDAVSAFEAALDADDENGLAYLHLAQSQLVLDQPASAILTGLESAVRLLPDNPRAHHSYAEMLSQTGEHRGAARHWRRALELRPDVIDARLGLAEVLEASGDLEGAKVQLEAAATLEPRNIVVRIRLANVLERLSQFDAAAVHAKQAAEISSASAPLYRRAADLFERARDAAEARRLRSIADRIDPPPKQRSLRELKEARAKGPSAKKAKR